MFLSTNQALVILLIVAIATAITKFLPFILFKGDSSGSSFINFLGKVLPYSAIGLLVVYCLKDANIKAPVYGLPEIVSVICIFILHCWKGNTLLSIGAGTAVYMALVQLVFV